jgi:nucleotide-binding universal stress UspA family protein
MTLRLPVICPIDFSEPSRGALRYGAAVAAHSGVGLTVLTVNDPLLVEAFDMTAGSGRLAADARIELERFFHDTFAGHPPAAAPTFLVATGKPAVEILELSTAVPAGLVVMSSRGATGVRKLFFGSTAERVLRETTVPVLLTPASDNGPATLADVRKAVRRILVPVDLSAALEQQVRVASRLAETVDVPLLLVHIIEPVRAMVPGHMHTASVDNERRDRAEQRLHAMIATLPAALRPEALVMFGEPSEEIVKIAKDRGAGLIVMGLQSSAVLGPRMGSVTYRVLCLANMLVLALPPASAPGVPVS